jgi:hypothetical protein
MTRATGAFVMCALCPLRTKRAPLLRPAVRIAATSEPPVGSVIAVEPTSPANSDWR